MEDLKIITLAPDDSSNRWYALRCKSNMEFIVNDQLNSKRIANYLPVYAVKPINPRSREEKPYFPGYLFVNDNPDNLYAKKVFLMRGVIGLVHFDGIPAFIPTNIIEAVHRQVSQRNFDFRRERSGLRAGEEVLVEDESLGQLEGVFEKCVNGKERVAVLLKIMQGSMMRVELAAEKVRRKPVRTG